MRKSLRILSNLRSSFSSDYGNFLGTEFFLKRKDELKEEDSGFLEEPSTPSLTPRENTLCDKSKISSIISNLTLNFSRRVPSKIKPVLYASIEENIDKISLADILDLVIALRKCNSFSSKLFKLFLERISEEIKQISHSNNDHVNFVSKICLELVEYSFEALKFSRMNNETSSKTENKENNGDLENNHLVNNIFKFICDNMRILEMDDLVRIISIFFSIQTGQAPPFITINGEYLSNLTKLILDYRLSPSSTQHSGNKIAFGPNSLYTCNILVKISKLHLINHTYHMNNFDSTNLTSSSDQNENFTLDKENPMNKIKEYVHSNIYPIISENITRFTSDNIVELVEVIRRLGEPFPMNLIDQIATAYVKHISQYTIDNMLKLVEEFNLMNIKNELVMLNTIVTLPRKVTTLDSFERVIKLLEVFKDYESEYLDTFITEQIYQIYHKINKKFLNRINKLIGE
ncbi:hypothetical protein TpMuguga_02g02405 [Theileria parva strain Muguga]|uniref:uncharacterized protein n=1 Tax=Theileria parva strain Muguga TaxID=333668 RepID=UPI001C61D029|nr:uncharacterized protein TpMuguga_02g02405 [Theileria parva strain Muguga]KAF5153585.1 hypothetical protein TpMuguga_02g02405 [Theileria parva strain Muguga]